MVLKISFIYSKLRREHQPCPRHCSSSGDAAVSKAEIPAMETDKKLCIYWIVVTFQKHVKSTVVSRIFNGTHTLSNVKFYVEIWTRTSSKLPGWLKCGNTFQFSLLTCVECHLCAEPDIGDFGERQKNEKTRSYLRGCPVR